MVGDKTDGGFKSKPEYAVDVLFTVIHRTSPRIMELLHFELEYSGHHMPSSGRRTYGQKLHLGHDG